MTLVSQARRDPTARLVAFALASGVPLACYLATASAHGYWLDGGEFIAASIDLGIAHPPGHPLAALVGRAVALVPLGPLSFRIALASALCTALAAAFLFSAIETTIRSFGIERALVTTPIALGSTWLVAGSYGWWFQAVRPEVYGLQALLTCVVLERVVALEAAWPTSDVRRLYSAALALGFALANHHLTAFLLLPAIAPTLARVYGARGRRPGAFFAAGTALGLATYVYLPIRAATDPSINLGSPTTVERVIWVVSAKVFQKDTGFAVQPMSERFADLAVLLVDNLHAVPLLLAAAGLYAVLRMPGTRRIGVMWTVLAVVNLAARAWLGPVRANPDVLGYVMPGFAAIGALAASFVAAALAALGGAEGVRARRTAVVIALGAAVMGAAQLHSSAHGASLAQFTATDSFDDARRRDLPPRAVVFAYAPQTIFRTWGAEAEEHLRPDVTFVAMPFIGYPGMVDSVLARDDDLRDVLRTYLLDGEVRQPQLQTLAARRPTYLEMDSHVPRSVYETVVPAGLFYVVLADGSTDADERLGTREREAVITTLYARLGSERRETETANQLLWMHYNAALYAAVSGDRAAAREAVRLGLGVNPLAAELRAFERALDASAAETGPMDITPFLPE